MSLLTASSSCECLTRFLDSPQTLHLVRSTSNDRLRSLKQGTVENLLSGGICGVIYGLFAGQPICVLSATGPTLVFEFIMYDFCE